MSHKCGYGVGDDMDSILAKYTNFLADRARGKKLTFCSIMLGASAPASDGPYIEYTRLDWQRGKKLERNEDFFGNDPGDRPNAVFEGAQPTTCAIPATLWTPACLNMTHNDLIRQSSLKTRLLLRTTAKPIRHYAAGYKICKSLRGAFKSFRSLELFFFSG
jgi:hypothetical protein